MALITLARLRRFTPQGHLDLLRPIVDNLGVLDRFGINTHLRVCHFLGQCAVEADHFTTMFERGNPRRFKGRGYIQITGQGNYEHYGNLVHVDLVREPDRAAQPDLAMQIAGLFWNENHLNRFADRDDAVRISRAINRGNPNSPFPANNESDRIQLTERAKGIFVETPDRVSPESTQLVASLGRDLQLAGFNPAGGAAAAYDETMMNAVRHFQERAGLPATGIADEQTLEALARAAAHHERGIGAGAGASASPSWGLVVAMAAAIGYLLGERQAR